MMYTQPPRITSYAIAVAAIGKDVDGRDKPGHDESLLSPLALQARWPRGGAADDLSHRARSGRGGRGPKDAAVAGERPRSMEDGRDGSSETDLAVGLLAAEIPNRSGL